MKTVTTSEPQTTLAATVAGEDLACGDYVTALSHTYELPSFLWDRADYALAPEEPVRLKLMPSDAGQPLKIFAICLPFVYARLPNRQAVTLDLRKTQLVRLDPACARKVSKALRAGTARVADCC